MAYIEITDSESFFKTKHKVTFDYMLLKSESSKIIGEQIQISDISEINRIDDCNEGFVCFMCKLSDGRLFFAKSSPQIYSKLSIASDPILSKQNPQITVAGKSTIKQVGNKIIEALKCSTCSG